MLWTRKKQWERISWLKDAGDWANAQEKKWKAKEEIFGCGEKRYAVGVKPEKVAKDKVR